MLFVFRQDVSLIRQRAVQYKNDCIDLTRVYRQTDTHEFLNSSEVFRK